MKTINKIDLCVDMIIASVQSFKKGNDIDYVSSILLAGAINEILEPLLKELGRKTKRGKFAELSANIAVKLSKNEIDFENSKKHIFRNSKFIYNSLKHAGDKRSGDCNISPSNDLEVNVDLRKEAEWTLSFAIENFAALPDPYVTQQKINRIYPEEFLDIFQTFRYEIG